MAPLLSYTDMVQKRPNAMITVLVPEYIPAHWWEQILHSQTAFRMKPLLLRPNTVVTACRITAEENASRMGGMH
jgi:hypothetical protein